MKVKGTAVAIVAVAALVGYGVISMWGREDDGAAQNEARDGAISAAESSGRAGSGSNTRAASGGSPRPPHFSKFIQPNNFASDKPEFLAPSPGGDPNEATPEEAREMFDGAMVELDAAIDGELLLTLHEEQALYARLTGSFEVLSAHVNNNDPEQRAFLEEAYAEMIRKMREAEIVPSRPRDREYPERAADRHRRHRSRG